MYVIDKYHLSLGVVKCLASEILEIWLKSLTLKSLHLATIFFICQKYYE